MCFKELGLSAKIVDISISPMRVTFWVEKKSSHLKRVDVKSKIPRSFTSFIPNQFHNNLIPPVILGFSVGFKELTRNIRERSSDVWKVLFLGNGRESKCMHSCPFIGKGRNRGTSSRFYELREASMNMLRVSNRCSRLGAVASNLPAHTDYMP